MGRGTTRLGSALCCAAISIALLGVGWASPAHAQRGDTVRWRYGFAGAVGTGGGENHLQGGVMIHGAVHGHLGVQINDLVGLYYDAGFALGGWPEREARQVAICDPTYSCNGYTHFMHTSSVMVDFTVDFFQVGIGPVYLLGWMADAGAQGVGGRLRLTYVGTPDGETRSGFTIGSDAMAAPLIDSCWALTIQLNLGWQWF